MTNKITTLKAFALVFLIIVAILLVNYFANPYKKIQGQYPEDGYSYLNFYKSVYSKEGFDSLLARLIIQNTDALSINVVASYIEDNRMCWLLPLIDKKCKIFEEYPKDTTWATKLEFRARESSKEMLFFSNGIYSVRDRLKSKCK